MKKPLVSIIITNYNYGKYIAEAIESAVSQTYENIEVIIIDDGSTDNSRSVIKRWMGKYQKIRSYEQSNKGVAATRNRGLKLSKGEFVVFLDSDDKVPEDYVQRLMEVATTKGLDVVYANSRRFGDVDNLMTLPDFNFEILKTKNIVNMSALIRKSAIGSQLFDTKLDKLSHEDWDFFLGLAFKGAKFIKVNDTQLMYRIHGKSRNSVREDENILRYVKMYVYLIDKYKKMYPGKMDFSVNSELVSWYRKIIEAREIAAEQCRNVIARDKQIIKRDKKIAKRDNIIKYNESLIKAQKEEIQNIRMSSAYKVGQFMTYIPRKLKGAKWIKS